MASWETLIGAGIALLVFLIILAIISYIFWLWMFIDAVKKRDNMWIILFIVSFLTGFLSGVIAGIYYIVEYKKK